MRIAVLDDYQDVFRSLKAYSRLAGHEVVVFHEPSRDPERLAHELSDVDAVVLTMQRTAIPRSVLEVLPRLKLISQTGRNTSHIDVAACTELGITVCAGYVGSPSPTAELAWALLLASQRNIVTEVQALKQGRWQTTIGVGLAGATLGIYAYGRIGSQMAHIGRAFGMNVVCWGREKSMAAASAAGFASAASREEFFASADILSLHLPLNRETAGIVRPSDLARMKPDSLLVNTSRAGIIEPGALVAGLRLGRPGRAAVDVFDDEPVIGGDHPLLKLDSALCTPHLGYVERSNYEAMFAVAVDQIVAFVDGKPMNVVNPAVSVER